MAKILIGTKIGMASVIAKDGTTRAVTLVQATPNTVSDVKTTERDGYQAVQLSEGQAKSVNKPQADKLKQLDLKPRRQAEFRVEHDLKVGDKLDVAGFSEGDLVKVTAVSKGKGWAGTIKRHNFSRQRKTHGAKGNTRRPGSIGSMYPQKVFKGKKMAGQMGGGTVTVRNLPVVLIDKDQDLIGIGGAVPGPRKGSVKIEAL